MRQTEYDRIVDLVGNILQRLEQNVTFNVTIKDYASKSGEFIWIFPFMVFVM